MRQSVALLSLITVAILACSPFGEPTPDIPATVAAIVETKVAGVTDETAPSPALSASGAMSILRHYLVSCIASWGPATRTEEQVNFFRNLATEANGDTPWSASHHRTDIGTPRGKAGLPAVRERWSVVGTGFESIRPALIPAPGTWLVTAGRPIAKPLDGPARLADLEFRRQIPMKDGSSGECGDK